MRPKPLARRDKDWGNRRGACVSKRHDGRGSSVPTACYTAGGKGDIGAHFDQSNFPIPFWISAKVTFFRILACFKSLRQIGLSYVGSVLFSIPDARIECTYRTFGSATTRSQSSVPDLNIDSDPECLHRTFGSASARSHNRLFYDIGWSSQVSICFMIRSSISLHSISFFLK